MITVHHPPVRPYYPTGVKIFLGGTIDMGKSDDWQANVIAYLKGTFPNINISIFNPRRPDWDSSWEQSKDNPNFRTQVEWELDYLEQADVIVMALLPDSLSPISLLEIGLFKDKSMLIYNPEGFWRKGNVDIVVERYKRPNGLISVYQEWDRFLNAISATIYYKNQKYKNVQSINKD